MKTRFCVLLILLTQLCVGQHFIIGLEEELDSINEIITSPRSHDTEKIASYISLSELLVLSHKDTVKPLCDKAINLIKQLPDALRSKPSFIKWHALAINNIGISYHFKGDYTRALVNYNKAFEMSKRSGNDVLSADILTNIGAVYFSQNEALKAIELYHEALDLISHEPR